MITPTSTFALRIAGQGAARASLASSIARTTTSSSSSSSSRRSSSKVNCPYSTASVSKKSSVAARPMGLAATSSIIARVVRQPCSQRSNSTASVSASSSSSSSSSSSQQKPGAAAAAEGGEKLDWNTFFQLRKSRRRWQLGFSVVGFGASFVGGAGLLATGAADPLVSQVPLDPFVTMGLMTMGFGALGWLVGPSLGSMVFYTLNKRWKKQMTVKEKEFFARIKKNRVDPSVSSVGNPVPDFYGEKISSVAGYRQWLKDQRAFNRKRISFV